MATLGKTRRPLLRIRTPLRNSFACLCVRAVLSSPGGAVIRTMLARRHTTDAAGPKYFPSKSRILHRWRMIRHILPSLVMCCEQSSTSGICSHAPQQVLAKHGVLPEHGRVEQSRQIARANFAAGAKGMVHG